MAWIRCREGQYAKDREPVMGSVYGIPERLKEISSSLFVMFNKVTQVFEVHDASQEGCTLACELPYEELDARALTYVRERFVTRFEELVREVDRHNERLAEEAHRSHMSVANDRMKDAMTYMRRHESADKLPEEMMQE